MKIEHGLHIFKPFNIYTSNIAHIMYYTYNTQHITMSYNYIILHIIARRDNKAFLSDQCKEIEEKNRMGKTRYLFKKLETPREHFMQRWAQ